MKDSTNLREWTRHDIENLDENVRRVSERLASGEAKLAEIDERLAEFDTRFAALDRRFAELNARFEAFNARYEAASGQISELEKETQEACRSTAYINARLEALEMAAMAVDLAPRREVLKVLQVTGGKETMN